MSQGSAVLVSLKSENRGTLAEMSVAVGTERVWSVLTSFEEMPVHLSGLNHSRILKDEGAHRVVEQLARVAIPFLPISFRVVLDVIEERPFLYFSQRKGPFKAFQGHWRVDNSSVGNGTTVRYYLEASLGHGLGRRPLEQQLRRMIRQNMQDLAAWIDNGE